MSKCTVDDLQRFSEIFGALSDPNRLRIFLKLASCCTPDTACEAPGEWKECVGELGKDIGLAPSTISHHIKKLSSSGLIKMARYGKRITCWADRETLDALQEFINKPPRY